MTTQTAMDFFSELERSGLVSADRIAEFQREAGDSVAIDCAKRLILAGVLTKWQARQLLNGNHKLCLGKYRLVEKLGEGGMGTVYKAQPFDSDRVVALKVMSEELAADESALRRFFREAEAMASVRHPNIVNAFGVENVGSDYFLVMEYVHGRDLNHWIKEHEKLPTAWSCECIRQAAVGLAHAHERGLIHRDIKPGNLLVVGTLTEPPAVKILDLGLARFTSCEHEGTELTNTGEMMGTPDYMAPEQGLNAKTVDIRADIYSLGCTLYRLLAGQIPFPGDTPLEVMMARLANDPPHVLESRSDVPPELDAVIYKMMAREASDRFQTPGELAAALAPFCCPDTSPPADTADQPELRLRLDAASANTCEAGEFSRDTTVIVNREASPTVPQPQQSRAVWIAPIACLLVALLGWGALALWSRSPGQVTLSVDQPEATITLIDSQGTRIQRTSPFTREPLTIEIPVGSHTLIVEKAGFEPHQQEFKITTTEDRHLDVKLAPLAAALVPSDPTGQERGTDDNNLQGLLKDALIYLTFDRDTFSQHGTDREVRSHGAIGHHGIIHGAELVPGLAGEALRFDGESDDVVLPTLLDELIKDREQVSVSVWYREDHLPGARVIFDVGVAYHGSLSMALDKDDQVRFAVGARAGGADVRAPRHASNAWRHLLGTWDGQHARLYLDGDLVTSKQTEQFVIDANSLHTRAVLTGEPTTARLGAHAKPNNRAKRLFRGELDEFLILPKAATPEQVKAIYARGKNGQPLAMDALRGKLP